MATIQGVYVALFGRPADPAGLAYFTTATQNGADLTKIGDLASTQEYKDRFAGQNNNQIVTSIYRSLFNRDPEAGGLNFFVNALNTGALSINNIAIAILDGAQGSDKTIVDAKVASAAAFTAALDTPVEIGTYVGNDAAAQGRAFLAGVTTTAKTAAEADTAVADIVAKANVGVTVALTAGGANNIVVGTAAGNTSDKNDTINATAAANDWAPATDLVDGGFGVDTFNATINGLAAAGTGKLVANGLKNVEIINISTVTAASTLDLTEAKQATQVWHAGTAAANFNLGVSGLALSTTVGLKGALDATVTTFTFADTTGTSDSAALALNAAVTTGGVNIAGVETLNITNEGTSSIGTVTAAAATAVNIAGKGSLSLAIDAGDTKTVTNTSTGTVSINVGAAEKLTTYTGSDAIDIVTTNTAGITANQVINTGAGADAITVNGGGNAAFSITLTGGAGSDLFYFGTAAALNNVNAITAADIGKSLVTISDFNKAEDSITYNNQTANARAVLTVGELGQISGQADLVAAITKAVEFREGTEDTFIFTFGTDAYIYTDIGANGLTAGDGLVKITGITAADLTASNFTFV